MSKPLLTTVEFINILNQFPPNLLSVCQIVTLVKKGGIILNNTLAAMLPPTPTPESLVFLQPTFFRHYWGFTHENKTTFLLSGASIPRDVEASDR